MALTAQSIVKRATVVLQDATSVRWTASELVDWLNDGQREIIIYRPDANSKIATGTLAAGTRQDLTTMTGISTFNPVKLMDITRNMASASNGYAVRLVPREILDAQMPGWHASAGSVSVSNYMFDPRDQHVFYVYPPALVTTQLQIIFSALPTDIAAPSGDYTTVVGNLSVGDLFGNALLDYILYRAYDKDAEFAENGSRSASFKASFDAALASEAKGTLMFQPKIKTGMVTTA